MSSSPSESTRLSKMPLIPDIDSRRDVVLSIRGMTCGSCVRHVQEALQGVAGVTMAQVDLVAAKAKVRFNPARASVEALRQAVAQAGYEASETPSVTEIGGPVGGTSDTTKRSLRLPVVVGLMGAVMLVGLYLGILTVAQSWSHALELFASDWYFLLAIVTGFGVQVGLFTYLRTGFRTSHQTGSATALTGAGTGTSTVSMLACCTHHLTDVAPLLGLSGAAIFLTDYQVPLMLLGIVTNLVGIIVMLHLISKFRRGTCPA